MGFVLIPLLAEAPVTLGEAPTVLWGPWKQQWGGMVNPPCPLPLLCPEQMPTKLEPGTPKVQKGLCSALNTGWRPPGLRAFSPCTPQENTRELVIDTGLFESKR